MVFKVIGYWCKIEDFLNPNALPDDVVLVIDLPDYREDGKKLHYFMGEPLSICNVKEYLINNIDSFDKIYTHDQELLNRFPKKAVHKICTYGASVNNLHKNINHEHEKRFFVTEDTSQKQFKISGFCGNKLFPGAYGHHLRRYVYNRQCELPDNVTIYRSSKQKPVIEEVRNNPLMKEGDDGRQDLFDTFQFSIVIQNSSECDYFTEILLDCLLTKTIPIFWGCPNIHKIFDTTGWIFFDTFEELNEKISKLTPDYYSNYAEIIDNNAKEALKYSNWIYYFEELIQS